MWNYGYALHSIFILLIVLVFYFSLPRLSVKINKAFLYLLWLEVAVLFFDITSSWAASNISEAGLFVSYLLNVCYFAFFFARSLALFEYTSIVFRRRYESMKVALTLVCIPFVIAFIFSILSPWTGLLFDLDNYTYHSGPFYFLVYYVTYFYFGLSSFITIRYRHSLRRRHFYSMLLYNIVLWAGIILRKVFPGYLIMDSCCLIAIIILYLAFGNPEFYLESRGGVFNSKAFRDYFEEHNGRLNHKIIGMAIHNYMEMRDIYGGRQLDQGITLISMYLTRTFPEYNVFYYRNGRFFLVGTPELNEEMAVDIIRDRFRHPWTADDLELYLETAFTSVSVSGAVASSDYLLSTLMSAMDEADNENTGELLRISDKDLSDYVDKASIKRALENAVEHNQVEVFLQPFIEAKSEKLVGAEALARIRDAEGNLIPPGVFIPVAEANGRINALGEQIFEKACRFVKEYDMSAMGMKWISVNLSPMQFVKRDLADRYASIVEKYGVNPGVIHLEITEVSLADESFMNKQISAMCEKGFRFALDDYGTGASNLSRIKHYPFVDIKIDMSVVWDYCKNPDEILPGMLSTFKRMGFKTTCEGIEDENMAKIVTDLGCDHLQGYLYSKPLPIDEFVKKYSGCNLHTNPI